MSGLAPLTLLDRGPTRLHARAVVASLAETIGKRELSVVRERLGLERTDCWGEHVEASVGPGKVLMIAVEGQAVTEVITGFGSKA